MKLRSNHHRRLCLDSSPCIVHIMNSASFYTVVLRTKTCLVARWRNRCLDGTWGEHGPFYFLKDGDERVRRSQMMLFGRARDFEDARFIISSSERTIDREGERAKSTSSTDGVFKVSVQSMHCDLPDYYVVHHPPACIPICPLLQKHVFPPSIRPIPVRAEPHTSVTPHSRSSNCRPRLLAPHPRQ